MIDTQAIRNKILDLAMRGQLTEQLSEDGTGEELFQKIQAEKQLLIKAKKIKKEKLMEKVTDDERPFTIPENWHWVRLRDLGVFSGGKTPSMSHKDYWENGVVPWVTSKDMKQKYIASSEMLISDTAANEMAIHPEKTVLFVVRSGILRRLFPVAILTECGAINQDLKALELYIPDMCEYVYYALKGFESTILFKYAKDGTTVNNIIFDALLTMPVPLPPFAEQQRIVDKIDKAFSVLDAIDTLQTQYTDNLTTLKAKLIDAAIKGKLTEQLPEDGTAEELYQQIQTEKQALIKAGKIKKEKPLPEIRDEEIPFEIPDNWKWCRINEIAYLTSGNQYEEVEEGLPYVKVADMNLPENQREIVTSSRYASENNMGMIPLSSIIFPKRGGAILTNKKRLVVKTPIFIDSNTMAMTMIEPETLLYIRYWFESINLGDLYTGTSIPQVNNKDIYPMIVPLPPLKEQKRIIEKLDSLLSTIEQ